MPYPSTYYTGVTYLYVVINSKVVGLAPVFVVKLFAPGKYFIRTNVDTQLPGVDVMIVIFCDFLQFSAKKLACFSKTNVMIKILDNLALF
jgi:hypothetical protein